MRFIATERPARDGRGCGLSREAGPTSADAAAGLLALGFLGGVLCATFPVLSEAPMIKLYGIPRSRAMRPLWMLEELGLPYENVSVSFVNETRMPAFLKLNPNGHIPVLQDGDLTLWESMAINLYLARRYDKGLWPKGSRTRAAPSSGVSGR